MPRFEKRLSEVAATDPVDHVARRALTVRLKAVRHYLQGALGGPDETEAVHQLRVWTRRAAAALKLFRPAIAESDQRDMRKLLRKLRRKAGAIRDCDVHCERLKSQPDSPPKRVLKALQEQRRKARRKLQRLRRRLTKDERFQDQADELLAGIAWPKRHSSRAAPPFATWCRQELTPLAERFFELAESKLDDDETLHAVRIAGKRLRYALELSIAALRAQPCQRLYEELSDVQDRFGEVCDQMAAVAHAREWLSEAKRKSRAARKLRTLLASEEQRLTLARRKLLRWWTPKRRAGLKRHWNAAL